MNVDACCLGTAVVGAIGANRVAVSSCAVGTYDMQNCVK